MEDAGAGTLKVSMVCFTCNICGAWNEVEQFASEPASCACGSNVRLRGLIRMLSIELFGRSLVLPEFPRMKAIRGWARRQDCYNRLLAGIRLHQHLLRREPRLDFTNPTPSLRTVRLHSLGRRAGAHSAAGGRAMVETRRMLKPHGFLGITVYCSPSDCLRERFRAPRIRLVPLGMQRAD
jgi:hypothetical protein